MKFLSLILCFFYLSTLQANGKNHNNDSLKKSMMPQYYQPHKNPEYSISLLYYGDALTSEDLKRIELILIRRFEQATHYKLKLNILSKLIIPFKQNIPKNYQFNNITDSNRLQRIWYYDHLGMNIVNEIYSEYKKVEKDRILKKIDTIAVITGAQFDGLGFASGRIAITEYPREIAWALPDGGRVEWPTDYQIVDELIHELGHTLGLGHASTQCQKPGMTYQKQQECCEASENKDDVLSYCRQRRNVNENFSHQFESCHQSIIENTIIPNILSGGKWKLGKQKSCD